MNTRKGGKSFRLATDKLNKGEKAWILVLLYFNSSAVSLHPWPLFLAASVIWNNVRPSLESIHQCRKKLPLTLIKNTICASQGGETERYGSPPPPPHSSSSMQFKLKSSVVIKFKLGLWWGPKTRLRHNRECAEDATRRVKVHQRQPWPASSHSFKQPVCTKAFWHLKKWIKTTKRGNERRRKKKLFLIFPLPQTDLFSLTSSASCLLDRLQNCQ